MSGKKWVWTNQPMLFHDNDKKEWLTIPAWTKGYLVKPNDEQREAMSRYQSYDKVRCYLVHLVGMGRYIGVDKLMMEDEWNERRDRLRLDGILPKD